MIIDEIIATLEQGKELVVVMDNGEKIHIDKLISHKNLIIRVSSHFMDERFIDESTDKESFEFVIDTSKIAFLAI